MAKTHLPAWIGTSTNRMAALAMFLARLDLPGSASSSWVHHLPAATARTPAPHLPHHPHHTTPPTALHTTAHHLHWLALHHYLLRDWLGSAGRLLGWIALVRFCCCACKCLWSSPRACSCHNTASNTTPHLGGSLCCSSLQHTTLGTFMPAYMPAGGFHLPIDRDAVWSDQASG